MTNRHQRDIGILAIERQKFWNVEPSVQRQHRWRRREARQRQAEIIGMTVNEVKLPGALVDLSEHTDMRGQRILTRWVEPQRTVAHCGETRARGRIPTGEEGYLVPQTH